MIALGAAACLALIPVAGFAFLTAFGFHRRIETMDWDERLALHALPLLPLLLLLVGLACFLCFTRRGLLIVRALALLWILDAGLLFLAFQSMNRPRSYVAQPVTPPLPTDLSGAARPVQALPGPVHVGIACSSTDDECWTIRYENGREVSRERSTGHRSEEKGGAAIGANRDGGG